MHTQYEQVFTRITQGIYDDAYQQFGDQPDIEHYTGTSFLTCNPPTATRITSETGCCMPLFLFGQASVNMPVHVLQFRCTLAVVDHITCIVLLGYNDIITPGRSRGRFNQVEAYRYVPALIPVQFTPLIEYFYYFVYCVHVFQETHFSSFIAILCQ